MQRFDFSHLNEEDKKLNKFDFSHLNNDENISSNPLSRFVNKQIDIEKQIGKDIFDIAKQVPGSVVKGIGNIPKDIDYLKENIPNALSLIKNNPGAAGRNALAGAGELAGQVSRLPPNLIDYLAHIGLISPESAKEFPRPFNEEEVKKLMDQVAGKNQPGGNLIRGMFRKSPSIYGAGKLIEIFNPLKYTKQAIANDVLAKEMMQKFRHQKAYDELWENANKSGLGKVNMNENIIDINKIKKYPNEDYYLSVEKFINDPTIENAHIAQSDLGKMIRSIKKNPMIVPPSEVGAIRKAAQDARDSIKNNMFRDVNNKLDKKLANKYGLISRSYGENVIPYTTSKAIQSYKAGDITLPELISGLKTGRFARRKGSAHPELFRPGQASNFLKGLGITAGGTAGAKYLIDMLMGQKEMK